MLEFGKVNYLNVIYKISFERYEPILKNFINPFKNLRKENDICKEIAKSLVNSFYGRLALRDDIEIIKLEKKNKSLQYESSYGEILDYILLKKKIKKKNKSNLAIAAAITAKARIKLYKILIESIEYGGRPLYCDTDSIVVAFDKKNDILDKQKNYLFFNSKKKNTIIKDCFFVSPKSYGIVFLDETQVIKINGIVCTQFSFKLLKYSFYNNKKISFLRPEVEFNKNSKASFKLKKETFELNLSKKRK